MTDSNPYAVELDADMSHRLRVEDALFDFVFEQPDKPYCVLLAYEDCLQFWQGEATYELARDSPRLYSRLSNKMFKSKCFSADLEQPTEFQLKPDEYVKLKEWVGPPRHSDLASATMGPSLVVFTVLISANTAMAEFRAGRLFTAALLSVWAVYPVIEYVLVRLMPHRLLFVFAAVWGLMFLWVLETVFGANKGLGVTVVLMGLFHVWQQLKKFREFRLVEPDK